MNLTNKLLFAMPDMKDKRFERSVIYMCTHNQQGSLGLMVNKPVGQLSIGHLLENLDIPPIDPANFEDLELSEDVRASLLDIPKPLFARSVLNGGPVENQQGFILHSTDYDRKDETINISESVSLTSTVNILSDISVGRGPNKICFMVGYVGWGPGQLENEIAHNSWLVGDIDDHDELIFSDKYDDKYEIGLKSIGIDPTKIMNISSDIGHA